jgi:hypothetical protein
MRNCNPLSVKKNKIGNIFRFRLEAGVQRLVAFSNRTDQIFLSKPFTIKIVLSQHQNIKP